LRYRATGGQGTFPEQKEQESDMRKHTHCILTGVGLALALAAGAPAARANLLVDPGFEANPLDTAANVLGNFTTYQGVWGVEVATIVGAENGVTPAQGSKMLRMVDDGQVATQGFQVTDVSASAGLIDAGGATVNLSALFNVDKAVPAAAAAVYVQFFSAANYGSQIGSYIGSGLTLDLAPNTWESISISGAVPPGTRWVLSQVAYSDVSLMGIDGISHPGYVDAADFTLTPEPAGLALLLLGGLALRAGRR
jgi:hypothetical protein